MQIMFLFLLVLYQEHGKSNCLLISIFFSPFSLSVEHYEPSKVLQWYRKNDKNKFGNLEKRNKDASSKFTIIFHLNAPIPSRCPFFEITRNKKYLTMMPIYSLQFNYRKVVNYFIDHKLSK